MGRLFKVRILLTSSTSKLSDIGGIISGVEPHVAILDVTPLTLGIETTGLSGPLASFPPY
jgi:hypothetical protein